MADEPAAMPERGEAVTAFTNPLRPRRHVAGPRPRPPTTTRSSTALLLVATVAVLNVIGVVMVLSASSVASLTNYGSPWYFFFRQIMWTLLGLGAFVFAVRFDYRRWRALVRPLLIVSVVLLVVVLVPGIGIYVSGSRRWLGAGMLRFQPSEIAKLGVAALRRRPREPARRRAARLAPRGAPGAAGARALHRRW